MLILGEQWVTVAVAAQMAGVRPVTIRSWVRRGKVQAHTVDGRLIIRWADAARAERDTRGAYVRQRRECITLSSGRAMP